MRRSSLLFACLAVSSLAAAGCQKAGSATTNGGADLTGATSAPIDPPSAAQTAALAAAAQQAAAQAADPLLATTVYMVTAVDGGTGGAMAVVRVNSASTTCYDGSSAPASQSSCPVAQLDYSRYLPTAGVTTDQITQAFSAGTALIRAHMTPDDANDGSFKLLVGDAWLAQLGAPANPAAAPYFVTADTEYAVNSKSTYPLDNLDFSQTTATPDQVSALESVLDESASSDAIVTGVNSGVLPDVGLTLFVNDIYLSAGSSTPFGQ